MYVQCYLPIHDLQIHYPCRFMVLYLFLKACNSRIYNNKCFQFTVFSNHIIVNWEGNSELWVHGFQIHRKFLVPKNVNWEVTLYVLLLLSQIRVKIWLDLALIQICLRYDTQYEEKCETKYETQYEKQCATKYEQECSTKYETEYETKYEEKCETKYETKYETTYEEKCSTRYKTIL